MVKWHEWNRYTFVRNNLICRYYIFKLDMQYSFNQRNTKILKLGIPVVWTCHDQWPMTGGCHCSDNCTKWKSGCGNCHLLQSENEKDKSRYIFTLKEKCFRAEIIQMLKHEYPDLLIRKRKWHYL